MHRRIILGIVFCMIGLVFQTEGAQADEPELPMVVVPDSETAKWLKTAYPQLSIGVLVHSQSDTYEVVNQRAWAMRHVGHFVYDGNRESTLAAIYRERWMLHGATVIDLRRSPIQRTVRPGIKRAFIEKELLELAATVDN